MTESIHHCDRCSARIDANRTLLHVQCGPLRAYHPAIDLCPACTADLARWLASRGGANLEVMDF